MQWTTIILAGMTGKNQDQVFSLPSASVLVVESVGKAGRERHLAPLFPETERR
jgi:hypothetical protein